MPESHCYLAPHPDDICFSVGSLATRIGGGLLINIFNVSSNTARGPGETAIITKLRDDEDKKFAQLACLERRNLNLSDSPLRGYDPFDRNHVSQEISLLRELLKGLLDASLSRFRPLLFCPMAIGSHRDHVITRDCVLSDYMWFKERYKIVFYEDLHYAADPSSRDDGLKDFFVATKLIGKTNRYYLPVSPGKLDFVRCYESQFYIEPKDLLNFTPADGSGQPHEALWTAEDLVENF